MAQYEISNDSRFEAPARETMLTEGRRRLEALHAPAKTQPLQIGRPSRVLARRHGAHRIFIDVFIVNLERLDRLRAGEKVSDLAPAFGVEPTMTYF